MPIRVLCIDDNPDMVRVMEIAVAAQADMQSVGGLHDAGDLAGRVSEGRPNVLVIDFSMPDVDVLEEIARLQTICPATRILVYSGFDDQLTIDGTIDAGGWGFVSKHLGMDAILDAIRRIAGGEVVISR